MLTVASLLPQYGGPAFSVSRLASALAHSGLEVGLWAADGSAWTTSAPIDQAVVRLSGGPSATLAGFRPDILHDNGLWLRHNHTLASDARRAAVPRVVSTRGMLEPWALRHKAIKKRLAWAAYQSRDLRSAAHLHATAEAEAENLRRLHLGVPVTTIANGVDLPPLHAAGKGETRTALFLGRIYPVKGLPMLVEAWAKARPRDWRLRLAGPDEAGHRALVQKLIDDAGLAGQIEFVGPVEGSAKAAAFAEADLFILPSHSESFGMAIGEALAHGLPVLTTTAVPWPALRQHGCGWSVEPTPSGLAEGLRAATAEGRNVLSAMGAKGRALIETDYSWDRMAPAFVRLYEGLAKNGGRAAA
jgi:glycosyltransferase involved in cell wall biosynthesis